MAHRNKLTWLYLISLLLFTLCCFLINPSVALAAGESGSFSISSPAAGDELHARSTYDVKWTYTGNPGTKINLSLYKDGKSLYPIARSISVGTAGSGSYSWKVLANYVPEGDNYTVRIFSTTNSKIEAFSDVFSVTHQEPEQQSEQGQNQDSQQSQQSDQSGTVIINDPSFVTLTALKNSGNLYDLQVKANNASTPVEVSYLVLNPNSSPDNPSSGIETRELTESENTWGGSQQYYGHTEIGGWAMTDYQNNSKSFALPHYRTCVMMLARYEKIYVVFLRENDGQLTYEVFQGGAFNGLEVPGLGTVTRSGDQFQVHSNGGAMEIGLWDKGAYQHDEVTGWAQAGYQANNKLYPVPKYGMFMMTIGRYGKLGLIIGNMNDGRLGTVCFSGSNLLGTETVSNLCSITSASGSSIRVRATGSDPVEVSQFAFDNTCWQWEVNGWGQDAYKANPQVLPLKHYTPGFLTCSRYDKEGIFFYNENDGQIGMLKLTSSTLATGSRVVQSQQIQTTSGQSGDIRVFLDGQQLSFDQPPVIVGGSTLVPMRAIFEALGATVNWDAASQMVTATKGDTTIKLIIGMQTAQVNGHETALSQPAQLMGGRTMVPLRFVAEALNAEVKWDGGTRSVIIISSGGGTASADDAKSVVDMFFSSLGSGNIDDALSLMDPDTLGSASTQAMWRSSFSSFASLTTNSIADANKEEWTSEMKKYRVDVTLHLKSGSQPTLWMEGSNTRWVSVKLINGQWKIQEFATGP